jgi:hypothetical protein
MYHFKITIRIYQCKTTQYGVNIQFLLYQILRLCSVCAKTGYHDALRNLYAEYVRNT